MIKIKRFAITVLLNLMCFTIITSTSNADSKNGMYVILRNKKNIKNKLYVSEIEVFSNGTNVALNADTTASSSHSAIYSSENAVDGESNNDKFWASKGNENEWLKISLGKVMPIDKIIIYPKAYFENNLDLSVLEIMDAENHIIYSTILHKVKPLETINIVFHVPEIPITKTIEERIDELNPVIEKLPPPYYKNGIKNGYDLAYCMPIGSGTVSAMLHYGDNYNIKLGKSNFYAIDGPDLEYQWVNKVHSPGLVHLSFGIPRSDIYSFEQRLDYNRGSVVMSITTPDGDIKVESYGVMGKDAMIYAITDTRDVKTVSASYTTWRPINENKINPITITAEDSQITVKEVHKYYTLDNFKKDKRVLPYSPSNVSYDNLYYNLGAGTCIAFADADGIIDATASFDQNQLPVDAKIETSPTSDTYYLIITISTTYDLAPEVKSQEVMDEILAADKDELEMEQLEYWNNFWQDSYIDLYGTSSEKPLQAWYTGLYNYAITTNPENPANFNGTGTIVYKDQMQWGACRYWQNNREIMWIMGAAGKMDFFKDYLLMYDKYFNDAKINAWKMGKLGVRLLEAPNSKKPGMPQENRFPSEFDASKLAIAINDHSYEKDNTQNASAREFNQPAELTQQMFDYVEFSGDEDFMNKVAVPWLKNSALFYLSLLRKNNDDYYHIMLADSLETYHMVGDPTPDMAAIRYLFAMILKHGANLGYEPEFIETVRDRFENLAPIKKAYWIDYGFGLEILRIPQDFYYHHISIFTIPEKENTYAPAGFMNPVNGTDPFHSFNAENPELYLVFPFAIFDSNSEVDDYLRAFRTLYNRSNIFPYSWDQTPIQAARLHMDSTFKYIKTHNDKFQLYPYGGWESCCSHLEHTSIDRISVTPYFDAMGVALTSIQEMLLQSHHPTDKEMNYSLTGGDGTINIIPAIDNNMAGRFKLHARGGFIVETGFQTGKKIKSLKITSERGESLKVKNPYTVSAILKNGEILNDANSDSVMEFTTESGDVFEFAESSQTKPAIEVYYENTKIPNGVKESYFEYSTFFKNASVGISKKISYKIENKGTEDLLLPAENPIEITGSDKDSFTLEFPDNITDPILPNENIEFSVVFTPHYGHEAKAEVVIHSNDADYTFAISGLARLAPSVYYDFIEFPKGTKFGYLPSIGVLGNDFFLPVNVMPKINLIKSQFKDAFNTQDGSITTILKNICHPSYSLDNSRKTSAYLKNALPEHIFPTPFFDIYYLKQDSTLTVPAEYGVLSNDMNTSNKTLTASFDSPNPFLKINDDGSFIFTAPKNSDSLIAYYYTLALDGEKLTSSSIYFYIVNDDSEIPPLAVIDKYTVTNGKYIEIDTDNGVLKNDWDQLDRPVTAEIYSQPTFGKVKLNEDGSFTYIAKNGFYGYDLFSYRANNGDQKSMPVSVVVHMPLPDTEQDKDLEETAQPQTYYLPAGELVNLSAENGILSNVISNYGDNVFVQNIYSVNNDDSEKTFTVSENGALSSSNPLIQTLNFNCDLITGRGLGFTKEISLVPFFENDDIPPETIRDSYACNPNEMIQISAKNGVLANDGASNQNTLKVVKTSLIPPKYGNLVIEEDGSFIYRPKKDFQGIDYFYYVAEDSANNKQSTYSIVTIAIFELIPELPPIANSDFYSAVLDNTLTVSSEKGVLANDINNSLSSNTTAELLTSTAHGKLTFNSDGSFEYIPESGFVGEDFFIYKALYPSEKDSSTTISSNKITAIINVKPNTENNAPNAGDDLYSVFKNKNITINASNGVLANDFDTDGDSLSVSNYEQPRNGSATLNPDGSFDYTPTTDFTGKDLFSYTVSDNFGKTASGTVFIKVKSISFSPANIPGLIFAINENNYFKSSKNQIKKVNEAVNYWKPTGKYESNIFTYDYKLSTHFPVISLENSKLMMNTSGSVLKSDIYSGNASTFFIVAKEYTQDSRHNLISNFKRGSNALLKHSYKLPHNLKVRLNGNSIDPFSDNVPENQIFIVTFTVDDYFEIGNIDAWNGAYGEFICYNRILKTDEIEQVETYLKEKWLSDETYYLSVKNGSSSGTYHIGDMISISAPEFNFEGLRFHSWTGATDVLDNIKSRDAVIKMPAKNISLEALYQTVLSINGTVKGDIATYIPVSLTGASSQTVYTDQYGNYSFKNLIRGNYTVKVDISDSYTLEPEERTLSLKLDSLRNINFKTSSNLTIVALDDSYNVQMDTKDEVFEAIGVLRNDSYPANSVNAVLVSDVKHGSLTFNSNGSFSYTPENGYVGNDSFSYKFFSRIKESNEAVVHLIISDNTIKKFNVSGKINGAVRANITISMEGSNMQNSILTDKNGFYVFENLSPGQYSITPSFPGYDFTPATSTFTISDSDLTDINFTSKLMQGVSNFIKYNGRNYLLNGINIPWNIKGADFGFNADSSEKYDSEWFDNAFSKFESAGINCVRVFLHYDGRNSPLFNKDGSVSGLNEHFFDNFDNFLQKAENHNLFVIPVLFSYQMLADNTANAGKNAGNHAELITNSDKLASYIKKALIPIVKRYAYSPNLFAFEIIDKPEFAISELDSKTHESVTTKQMRNFCALIADAIHQNSSKMVYITTASIKYISNISPGKGNIWSDKLLSQSAGINSHLDFYGVDYQQHDTSFNPFNPELSVKYWDLDKKTIITAFKISDDIENLSEIFSFAQINGFAGFFPWSFNSINNNLWNHLQKTQKTVRNKNIDFVDYPGLLNIISISPTRVHASETTTATVKIDSEFDDSSIIMLNGVETPFKLSSKNSISFRLPSNNAKTGFLNLAILLSNGRSTFQRDAFEIAQSYKLTVIRGNPSGNYFKDEAINLSPENINNAKFKYWKSDSENLISDINDPNAILTMPDHDLTVKAIYSGLTYSVSGKVSGDKTKGIRIVLSASGFKQSTQTDTNGNFIFNAVPEGEYSIVPSLEWYDFSPVDQNITVDMQNTENIEFSAIAKPYYKPVASDDSYTTTTGELLSVKTINGVMNNDNSIDFSKTHAILKDKPKFGSLQFKRNGEFSYKPQSNFSGLDHFSYYIYDGRENSKPATVKIYVRLKKITIGSMLTIKTSEIAILPQNTVFDKTPKIYGVINGKTVALKKSKNSDNNEVKGLWKKKIRLYDKSNLKNGYQAINGIKQDAIISLKVKGVANGSKFDADAGSVNLVPPAISSVSIQGNQILVKGSYFGQKPPKVLLLSINNGKEIKCKTDKRSYFFNQDTAESSLSATFQNKQISPGTYKIIINNKIGIGVNKHLQIPTVKLE